MYAPDRNNYNPYPFRYAVPNGVIQCNCTDMRNSIYCVAWCTTGLVSGLEVISNKGPGIIR
jgi:hypothetical protein